RFPGSTSAGTIGYNPIGLNVVAVVEKVAVMLSPATTPDSVPVSGGLGANRTFTWLAAVTVSAALAIANDCVTAGAGAYLASPACDAVMLHEPAPVRCTSDPATVHWPEAA